MKFVIKWYTGAPDDKFEGTLDECKRWVDDVISYTQEAVAICLPREFGIDDEVVCYRSWVRVAPDEEAKQRDIISYGDFGYYDEWSDVV